MIRTTLIVSGNVQKGDYRGKVISIAKEIGITGIAQNLSNGTVRIVAEGVLSDIERFRDEIWIRNFLIKVTDIKKEKTIDIYEREYESFYKLVGEGETDERIDTAAESLKKLGTDIGNFISKLDTYILEQKEHNLEHDNKMDLYILEQKEHNKKMDLYILEQNEYNKKMEDHNSRLEKILEKFSEK